MLKSLLIKNFALIDSLEIEFSRGLNIITGETGAGKSVIVEALLMALGERASSNLIREGEKKAVIEGVFKLTNKSSINILLEENQIDTCDERDSSTSHRMTGDDERDSSTSLRMTGDDERDSSTSLRMTGDDERDSSTSLRMTGDDERDSSTSH
ncbi:MAG: AAA family ATPase, partial [Bacteroidetes bacterium]|nr:AAA family ATPase [Bacteroidota bacterium]